MGKLHNNVVPQSPVHHTLESRHGLLLKMAEIPVFSLILGGKARGRRNHLEYDLMRGSLLSNRNEGLDFEFLFGDWCGLGISCISVTRISGLRTAETPRDAFVTFYSTSPGQWDLNQYGLFIEQVNAPYLHVEQPVLLFGLLARRNLGRAVPNTAFMFPGSFM